MSTLRLLLTFWLCLSLPYAAASSALRDPACIAGRSMAMPATAKAPPSMHHMATHAMHQMPTTTMTMSTAMREVAHTSASDAHKGGCGCLLSCTCIQACAAPAFTADYTGSGTLPTLLRQEAPGLPATPARRAPSLTELLRPPTARA